MRPPNVRWPRSRRETPRGQDAVPAWFVLAAAYEFVMLPKFGANRRVPLMTVPSALVNTPFSEKGPHVALPAAT